MQDLAAGLTGEYGGAVDIIIDAHSHTIAGLPDEDGVMNDIADGTVRLTLADGAHGVRLAGGTIEAYIDNYCGFGIVEDAFRPLPALTLEG